MFNKEEDLDKIKIDISFFKKDSKLYKANSSEEETQTSSNDVDLQNGESNNIVSNQSVAWTKNMLSTFPEIKPLTQILKRFLKIKNLNSPHKGNKLNYLIRWYIFLFLILIIGCFL